MVAGLPCRCMATHPTRCRAATGHREADTSLIMEAPALHGGLGHDVLGGVDRHPDLAGQRLDHRDHPPELLGGGDRLGAGPGRLTADIDDVGPFLDHLMCSHDRPFRFEPPPAI